MARMFYTLDETIKALGKTEEEIRQYAREGRLREFRDGPRLMFKADQVEALVQDMNPNASHTLAECELETPAPKPEQSSPHARLVRLETQMAEILAQREVEKKKSISELSDSVSDLSLDIGGSGSGLLDLTKENDDTCLGAELLDEIIPSTKTFRYEGMNPSGQEVKGEVYALDSGEAVAKVRAKNVFPTSVREGKVCIEKPKKPIKSRAAFGIFMLSIGLLIGFAAGVVVAYAVR